MLRSPFKYPGAKTKLAEEIVKFLDEDTIIEPFVGGGSVLCWTLHTTRKAVINDLDGDVSAFWQVVFGDPKVLAVLAGRLAFQPTVQSFLQLQKCQSTDLVDRAFKALVLNRCSFSGIMSAGPIGGLNQESQYTVDCRYNYKKLVARINALGVSRGGVIVLPALDFEDVLALPYTGALYMDPPYYVQGDSLYKTKMSPADHVRLATLLKKESRTWLLSYDNVDEIKSLYAGFFQITTEFTYEGTHKPGKELLVSNKDLVTWRKKKKGLFG